MKAIIDSIKNRILLKTNIKDVRRFNNQIRRMEDGKDTLNLPTALIELTDITYGHKKKDIQYGNCVLKIHIVSEEYNDEPEVNFDLWEKVNNTLNQFSDGVNFHPLIRTGEVIDNNYSNVVVYTISFDMAFVDYVEPEIQTDVTEAYVDLQIQVKHVQSL
jgi:hypothetical protein